MRDLHIWSWYLASQKLIVYIVKLFQGPPSFPSQLLDSPFPASLQDQNTLSPDLLLPSTAPNLSNQHHPLNQRLHHQHTFLLEVLKVSLQRHKHQTWRKAVASWKQPTLAHGNLKPQHQESVQWCQPGSWGDGGNNQQHVHLDQAHPTVYLLLSSYHVVQHDQNGDSSGHVQHQLLFWAFGPRLTADLFFLAGLKMGMHQKFKKLNSDV